MGESGAFDPPVAVKEPMRHNPPYEQGYLADGELAEMTVDARRGELSSENSLRLIAVVERLQYLHDLDHKLANHWQSEAERFEGMWRMECEIANSRQKRGTKPARATERGAVQS